MKRTGLIAAVALSATVAGCVLTNPTGSYVPSIGPASGQGVSAPAAGAGALPESLTLPKAIEIALANNPGIAAEGWDIRAAEARRDLAVGAVLPSLRAVGGYTRHLDDQRLIPSRESRDWGSPFTDDIFSADLVLTTPLYTGGRLISEIKAAELLREAVEHRLARSREELIFNVSSLFYGIQAQGPVIDSLEFSRKALQEHRRRIQDLLAVQKAARVDLLRTEVRLADLEQRLVSERNVLAVQKRALANLLGISGAEQPIALEGSLTAPEQEPTTSLKANLATALRQRPDYLAARAAFEAQARKVDAARAAHYPTVALQGAYGGRWAPSPSLRPPGANEADDVGSVGIVVDVPVFEGGRIDAAIREQKAQLESDRKRLRELELRIHLDVETATLNLVSARERFLATEKAIEQADESLRIEREKYDLGKGAIVDVLDAQSALLDSQTNYYRALAEYHTAAAQLHLAVGEQP